MTDEALIVTVTLAQQGDTRAFDVLVRRYQNTAVAYARTLLRDPAAAEDAAQDAFVQAWRDLPRLTEPAAFSAWLRRIVFKFCDRIRRSSRPTLQLDEAYQIPEYQGPSSIIEQQDDAARVRAAIDVLPDSLREITFLYYVTGHDTNELAAFLELPLSTVKNRLYAARKRLRKELWAMAETILQDEQHSQAEAFAANVLARILREFQEKEAADPRNVDQSLLSEGRTAVFEILGNTTQIDEASLRSGFMLLWRKQDWQSLSTLLMRYLTQILTDSETAWAYLHLATAIALSGSAAGAVLAHEAFERWIPGKSPILSGSWPHYPTPLDATDISYAGDDVQLLFLSKFANFPTSYWNANVYSNSETVEFIQSYLKAWYNTGYLTKVDAVLAKIPETPHNRSLRFHVLHMAANACGSIEDLDSARSYALQQFDLAQRSDNLSEKAELMAQVIGQLAYLARRQHDHAAFSDYVKKMLSLLRTAGDTGGDEPHWLRGQRQAFAFQLISADLNDVAMQLWETNEARGGQVNSYGYVRYAATIWKTTRDRKRVVKQLMEARAHEPNEANLLSMFNRCAEFEDERDAPMFLRAIGAK